VRMSDAGRPICPGSARPVPVFLKKATSFNLSSSHSTFRQHPASSLGPSAFVEDRLRLFGAKTRVNMPASLR